jgi:hypothetical protein
MEWSRVRSIAQEAELWTSIALNSWIVLTRIAFVARRVKSLILIAEIAHRLSALLLSIAIAASIVGIYEAIILGSLFILRLISWLTVAGIILSLISLAALALEWIRRAAKGPITN